MVCTPEVGAVYFVFGYKRSNIGNLAVTPVIGYYNPSAEVFIIDYAGMYTSKIYNSFVNNEKPMPFVMLSGVDTKYYNEALNKNYVIRDSFCIDEINYIFNNDDNDIIAIKRGEYIELPVCLSKGYIWVSNQRRTAMCEIWFNIEEFLWSISVDIDIVNKSGMEVQKIE